MKRSPHAESTASRALATREEASGIRVTRKTQRTLLILILINIAASLLHYGDNLLFFVEYPEPPWVSTLGIDRFWFLMTPFAFLGYYFFRKRQFLKSYLSLYFYGLMSLATLGHYLYAPMNTIAWRIHVFNLLEAVAATILIGYVIVLHRQSV